MKAHYMMFSTTFSFQVVCSNLPGINLPIYVNHIEAPQRSYDLNDNLKNNFSLYSFDKLIISVECIMYLENNIPKISLATRIVF